MNVWDLAKKNAFEDDGYKKSEFEYDDDEVREYIDEMIDLDSYDQAIKDLRDEFGMSAKKAAAYLKSYNITKKDEDDESDDVDGLDTFYHRYAGDNDESYYEVEDSIRSSEDEGGEFDRSVSDSYNF